MKNVSIILVAPQMGENIGAVARIMKNFGLSDLRIVMPRDGWPNLKARETSVGAIDIIDEAVIFSSLKEALSDLSYVFAAASKPRDMNKNYVISRQLTEDINLNSKIGIMFGRESSGLSNDEITHANKILVIDCNKSFNSLNLSHAVGIICYELFGSTRQVREDLSNRGEYASKKELNHFYDALFLKLEEKKFFRVKEKTEHLNNKIRNIFARIDNLSHSEVQILHGIIKVLSDR